MDGHDLVLSRAEIAINRFIGARAFERIAACPTLLKREDVGLHVLQSRVVTRPQCSIHPGGSNLVLIPGSPAQILDSRGAASEPDRDGSTDQCDHECCE